MTNKHVTTDSRPHFLPGIYAWLAENFAKVHVVVLTDHPKFSGPAGLPLVEQILPVANPESCESAFGYTFKTVTLNLGVEAVGKFRIDAEGFEVSMRFNQKEALLYIPFEAIHSVYVPGVPAITPFNFILRPGQESYSCEVLNKGSIAIVNAPAVNDAPKVESVAAKRTERPNHLRLVK